SAAFNMAVQAFLPMNCEAKLLELTPQQIDPIQDCRTETMKMAEHMPHTRCTAAYAGQVFVRGATRSVRSDDEVSCNRVQQQPGCRASNVHRDPRDYAERSGRAAFGQSRPAICLRNFASLLKNDVAGSLRSVCNLMFVHLLRRIPCAAHSAISKALLVHKVASGTGPNRYFVQKSRR